MAGSNGDAPGLVALSPSNALRYCDACDRYFDPQGVVVEPPRSYVRRDRTCAVDFEYVQPRPEPDPAASCRSLK